MKSTYLFILTYTRLIWIAGILIFVDACQFDLPIDKTLKICQKPLGVVYTPSTADNRVYNFSLNGTLSDLSGSISWKLLGPTNLVVSQSTLTTNQLFSVNTATLVDGTHTIIAESTTACSEKVILETKVNVLPPDNSWTLRNYIGFPTARGNCFTFNIGTKAYIGSGYEPTTGKRLTEFYEYDSATGQLKRLADFPGEARTNAVAFALGDNGYVCAGYGSTIEKNDLWQYDPAKNSWTQKTSLSGEARFGAMAFSINNKGYIGGGSSSIKNGVITYFKDFWEYDPNSNTWSRKTDIPVSAGFGFGVGFAINGKGYMGLGLNTNQNVFYSAFWEYSPITNQWIAKATFPGTARHSAVAFSIFKGNFLGYVGLGKNSSTYFRDFYAYDPASNSWTRKTDFIFDGRDDTFGFAVGQRGFVSFPGSVYEYNP